MRLVKHHGFGNDFLVAFDVTVAAADGARLARAVCDRRRGVGADGLLVASDTDAADAQMVLFNADGSRAEMSGNGIRCFAHALAARDQLPLPARLTILTDAGLRSVELAATPDPLTLRGTAEMGAVSTIDPPPTWADIGVAPTRPVAHLSVGNPHAVVAVEDVRAVDLAALGARVPDVNLEVVQAGPGANAITMRVHERGVGITEACGTGACAAAVAAWRWGIAEPENGKLVVQMDGGSASVAVDSGDTTTRVSLTGPTTYIATIDIPTA